MALYNNGFPVTYPQYYGNQYQQPAQQSNQPMQNGGIISVPNIEVARNYLVSPNTTVTFIDENAPCVYTKTRRSQFDAPIFEKYNLVKDDSPTETPQDVRGGVLQENTVKNMGKPTENEIRALRDEFGALKKEVLAIKKKLNEQEGEDE